MSKKHGWVLEMKKNHPEGWVGFYSDVRDVSYAGPLKLAFVCSTRKKIRAMANTDREIVRKVKVTKSGKAVKIIPGR
jgi:hypothetical protein